MHSSAIQIRGLTKRYGTFTATRNIDLDVAPGHLISLLGPSGCGKTTILRMIAGFIDPTEGSISVDGEVISDTAHVMPPERRNMGMVFQSYAVWPHMTVFDNIAYGLRARRTPSGEVDRRVNTAVELVGLGGQATKYPNALSGGQQQRVALARALVTEPRILLLDEPLSNLDSKLRESMRFELRRIQQELGITTIFVTHSQEEALVMSDDVAVMRDGQIIERNSPHDLYSAPKTKFVAGFIGLANIIDGKIVARDGEKVRFESKAGVFESRWNGDASASALMIRPEHIALVDGGAASPPQTNCLDARISEASFNGSIVDYLLDYGGPQPLRAQAFTPQKFKAGASVRVSFPWEYALVVTDR